MHNNFSRTIIFSSLVLIIDAEGACLLFLVPIIVAALSFPIFASVFEVFRLVFQNSDFLRPGL